MTSLEDELESARRTIQTDGYPMSVGELTNLYRDGELVIQPPFQRLFRWDDSQKSKLIESILIGIPLPSIFVAQDESGKWELVDGLQRVSTLLQFQGLLDHTVFPPLQLTGTKYLPSLEGVYWDNEESDCLTPAQRLDIKRAKIDVKIVQRGSDPKTKFDLFQRLNSFGSKLSNQEVRNAQLVGVSPSFVGWLGELASHSSFLSVTRLADGELARKFDEELVLRFLFLHSKSNEEVNAIKNFQDELESYAIDLALQFDTTVADDLAGSFTSTFDALDQADPNILRRWDAGRTEFAGAFLITSFEAVAVGLGSLIAGGSPVRTDLREAVIEFWNLPEMAPGFATGKSTEVRLRKMIPTGRAVLTP